MAGTSPTQSPIGFDNGSLFLNIKTDVQLASYLGIELKKLNFLLYKAKERYVQFDIPKKSGGSRKILAPIPPLRELQYRIRDALEEIYVPTRYTHGYVESRSIVTNASKHAGRKFLLSIDIKDFFPSINYGRIYGLFKAHPFHFPDKVAAILAQVCTHDNQLPQGAPTSPVLSNMICRRLDRGIEKVCKKIRVRYTRYADDLSFSWNEKTASSELLDSSTGTVILSPRLKELFEKNGFEINYSKIHLQTHLERQIVTGIKVNNEKLNLRRTFPRNIRAMLHAWEKYGYELAEQEFRNKYHNKHRYPSSPDARLDHVVKGKLNYMRMVCGPDHSTYKSLLNKFNELTDQISHETINNKIPDSLWVIVNESTCEQGTAFLLDGYGVVTCAHVLAGGNEVYAFRANKPNERFAVIPKCVDANADIALIGMVLPQNAMSLSP